MMTPDRTWDIVVAHCGEQHQFPGAGHADFVDATMPAVEFSR
jgi:hypothetical protein